MAIRLTLYRIGERSPIVEALTRALERKKEVAIFVELKARFDETRNVGWVRRLEEAGATVVYGVVGLKNHAKVGLVLRREDDGLRHYVHIGTGNYNAATAKVYTDLSLFSADRELGADLHDLFNQLTGSSRGPTGTFRRIAVAPDGLLPWLLESIERETRARPSPAGPPGSGRSSTASPTTRWSRRSTARRVRASRSSWWCGDSACSAPGCRGTPSASGW